LLRQAQAFNQMQASMAAVHTTSMTGSHVIYDLASRPECIKPLRQELDSVLAAEPVPYLSKTSTPKLKLLDSFCKESQRMNPLGQLTFNRKVLRDITLHDGTVLPAGTNIGVASAQRAGDERVFTDPQTFDPWRFYRLREQKGHESRYQFVTTSLDSLSFGYGNHACPGRFFANNELKVIVTYVLNHYGLKMPEGQGRPENIPTAGGARPDTSKSILMRKRTDLPA
jgi:cytochrome P450